VERERKVDEEEERCRFGSVGLWCRGWKIERVIDDIQYDELNEYFFWFRPPSGTILVCGPCINVCVRCTVTMSSFPGETFGMKVYSTCSPFYSYILFAKNFALPAGRVGRDAKKWLQTASQTGTPIGHVRTKPRSGRGQKQYQLMR
jgi:hypothetical protein